MDERRLELSQGVPQGCMHYAPVGARMVLRSGDVAMGTVSADCTQHEGAAGA